MTLAGLLAAPQTPTELARFSVELQDGSEKSLAFAHPVAPLVVQLGGVGLKQLAHPSPFAARPLVGTQEKLEQFAFL